MAKNFISNKDETVRMFKSDLLESFSRVHYLVPVALFLPVILFFLYRGIFLFHLPLLTLAALILFGLLIWTLTEYILHRFVFHWELPGKFGRRIHFIFHGVHHDYPSDSKRLVMVPTVSIPLAALFYLLFRTFLGNEMAAPFFVGFLLGYLFYDLTHYAIHHFNFKSKFWLEIKNHHMLHHYQNMNQGYGVSSKIWDHVFRTTFKKQ